MDKSNFIEFWVKRSMTPIFYTSLEYPVMHVWGTFGEFNSNLWWVIMPTSLWMYKGNDRRVDKQMDKWRRQSYSITTCKTEFSYWNSTLVSNPNQAEASRITTILIQYSVQKSLWLNHIIWNNLQANDSATVHLFGGDSSHTPFFDWQSFQGNTLIPKQSYTWNT